MLMLRTVHCAYYIVSDASCLCMLVVIDYSDELQAVLSLHFRV